jgi:carbamoyl-phosphate synthase large subunit
LADFTVLLSSSGRRVELLELLRSALIDLGVAGRVIAADAVTTSPAAHLADGALLVPRCDDAVYRDALLAAVEQQGIGLIVPTIDTELPVLVSLRADLQAAGAHVLASGPATVAIAGDKHLTAAHLRDHCLPAPRQWSAAQARADAADLPYPVIANPAQGSASIGVNIVNDRAELLRGLGEDIIVQELALGREYTVDVWVEGGRAVCVVPRRRIEVRAGEVIKGVTERRDDVIDLALRTAQSLPDADGPLTIQIMRDDDGAMAVIEINARLGGGYPLSAYAGAPTLRWAIQRALGLPREPVRFDWEPGVLMLRHDRSVLVHGWESTV